MFFTDDDYRLYRDLMAQRCGRSSVEIWTDCLMPNDVHLIATPENAEGLRRGIGEAHRRYTKHVNFGEGWRGFLWQGRFASFPLDGDHFLAAARSIELNPVRARLADTPESWQWGSARAHLSDAPPLPQARPQAVQKLKGHARSVTCPKNLQNRRKCRSWFADDACSSIISAEFGSHLGNVG